MALSQEDIDNLKLSFLDKLLNFHRVNPLQEVDAALEKKTPEELKSMPASYKIKYQEISETISKKIKGEMQIFYANRMKKVAEHINSLEEQVKREKPDLLMIHLYARALKDYYDAFDVSLSEYKTLTKH
jgi:hypothetical protein